MKNTGIDVASVYRGIAKAARRLHLALEQLPPELRADLQRATYGAASYRGAAITQLVKASRSINHFAAWSVVDDYDWYRGGPPA